MIQILGLDLARRTGWAFGPAGSVPQSGAWELRKPGEDIRFEGPELLRRLQRMTAEIEPQYIVVERWMDPAAQPKNENVINQLLLHGALIGWAGIRRFELHQVDAGHGRKMICGRSRGYHTPNMTSEERRKATKQMVVRTVQALGMLPRDCNDDDRADAIVNWCWGESCLARARPRLVLA